PGAGPPAARGLSAVSGPAPVPALLAPLAAAVCYGVAAVVQQIGARRAVERVGDRPALDPLGARPAVAPLGIGPALDPLGAAPDPLGRRHWALVGAVVLGLAVVGSSAAPGGRPELGPPGRLLLVAGVPALALAALALDRRRPTRRPGTADPDHADRDVEDRRS